MVLSGLSLGGGQYVDGVAPLRSNGFSSSAIQSGEMHGSTSAGSRQLFCPSGYRMTGVFGKSGSYIDSIGIICKTEDQSQTYTSQVFGGAGGSVDFNLSCPPGRFVTDLNGNAGTYLNRLYLGCR